jgi:hypothetical protein
VEGPERGGTLTLDRELEELLREENIEPGDHERFSHYVKKDKILESAITGKPCARCAARSGRPAATRRSSRSARRARDLRVADRLIGAAPAAQPAAST